MDSSPKAEPGRAEFGRLRGFFWPIHSYELKKVLPMLGIFFFISLVYSLLRNTKDTLIVTTPGGGAGLIPFLKVYGTIPGSVLIMLAYARLSRWLPKRTMFLAAIAFFMGFFLLFAFLYPLREALEPSAWAARWQGRMSPGPAHLVAMLRHWVLALFYVMSELWGSVALSFLFWGFANDITRVEESKRFYGLFGLGANLALMAVGLVNHCLHALDGGLATRLQVPRFQAYLYALMALVFLCGAAIIALYLWVHRVVQRDPRFAASVDPDAFGGVKASLPLGAGLAYLARSRYLRYIAMLVLAYGIAINLVEVTWKHHLGLLLEPAPGRMENCSRLKVSQFPSPSVVP